MRALAYLDISKLSPDDLAAMANDEDAMHVRLIAGGPWHRQATHRVQMVTACGETLPPIRAMGWTAEVRRAVYEGPLCPVCFTEFELAEAARLEQFERLMSVPDSSNNGDIE